VIRVLYQAHSLKISNRCNIKLQQVGSYHSAIALVDAKIVFGPLQLSAPSQFHMLTNANKLKKNALSWQVSSEKLITKSSIKLPKINPIQSL